MNQSIKALLALVAFVGTSWVLIKDTAPNKPTKQPNNVFKEIKEPKRYDKPDQAAAWLAARRQTDKGTNSALQNIRIKQQIELKNKSKKDAADMPAMSFEDIGPGIFGGRIRAFAVHPEQEGVLLAGGVSGGMWKSVDDGKSWQPKADFLPNIMIGSMTTDPDQPNRVYVGTGEGFFNIDAAQGAGIYVSEDFGETWNVLNETLNNNFYFVNRLARIPDSDILLAATRRGIFRSEDSGQTWSEASAHATAGRGFVDLRVNPSNSNHVLAVHYGNANDSLGLQITTPASLTGTYDAIPAGFGPAFAVAGINNQIVTVNDSSGFQDDGCQAITNNITGKIALIQRGTCDFTIKVKNAQTAGAIAVLVFQSNLDAPFTMGGEDDSITIPSAMISKTLGDGINAAATVSATIKPQPADPLGRFVMESSDGGNSWSQLNSSGLPVFNLGRMELNFGDDGVVYVAASSADDATLGLWRSPGQGQLFTKTNSQTDFVERQGWYDLAIAVNPSNSSHVLMGAIDQYVTHDGGDNININTYWSPNLGQSPQYVHADHHGYFFSPHNSNHIYIVSDGGVSKSEDGGQSWTSLNNGLNISQSYGIAVSPEGDRVTSGTQDNGSQMYYGNSSDWIEWQGGDGGYSAWDQQSGQYLYGSYVNGQMYGTDDRGLDSNRVRAMTLPDTDGAAFIQPFVLDDNNGNHMLVGTDNVFYTANARSLDNATWTDVSGTLDGSSVSAVAFNPHNSSQAFVGTSLGNIYRIDNLGSTNDVTTITPSRLGTQSYISGTITDLKVSPGNNPRLYATLGDYRSRRLISTSTSDQTWRSDSGDLPVMPLYQVSFDPMDSSRLFVGSELGLWVSTDTGWEKYDYGVAYTRVIDLVWHGDNTLFIGTHGRGTFKASRSPVSVKLNKFVTSNSSCDDDTFLDGGESGTILVGISNDSGVDLTGVLASWNNPAGFTFASSNMNLGTLPAYSNTTLPIQVSMDGSNSCLSDVDLDITVAHQNGSSTHPVTLLTGANQSDSQSSFSDNAENDPIMMSQLDFGNSHWQQVSNAPFEGSQSWFTTNEGNYSDKSLISPWLTLAKGGNELSFALRYDMEGNSAQYWDGAVLEIRTDKDDWHDIGHNSSVAYDGLLYNNTTIQVRNAWSGSQLTWRQASVDLAETYAGQKVQFRFRVVSDGNTANTGFWVDDIQMSNAHTPGVISCDTCISDGNNPRPNKGLWFDPGRDGHGFIIESVGFSELYHVMFYTYDSAGEPEWYDAVLPLASGILNEGFAASTMTKPKYIYAIGQGSDFPLVNDPNLSDGRLSIDFNVATAAAHPSCQDGQAGRILTHVALAQWKINDVEQTWCIQPLVAERSKANPDLGTAWFAGEQDTGWGLSLAHLQDQFISYLFYYDSDGIGRWAQGQQTGFEIGQDYEMTMFNPQGYDRLAAASEVQFDEAGTITFNLKHATQNLDIDGRLDIDMTYTGVAGGEWIREDIPVAALYKKH